MSGQGADLPEPIRHEATQESIERVQALIAVAAMQIREERWPVRVMVFPPGSMIIHDAPFPPTQNDEYVYALLVPIAGAPDLWRQAANRDKREPR